MKSKTEVCLPTIALEKLADNDMINVGEIKKNYIVMSVEISEENEHIKIIIRSEHIIYHKINKIEESQDGSSQR